MESESDSESNNPPFPELDTDSVTSPSPSKLAHDANSESKVLCTNFWQQTTLSL